ncbi:MAG: SDR family NAD(P)-dependent oxidoreductase [Sinimarinibacterium sp.]|jgi:NAD(P)-dependent dehydrogenase (short-subunit alcohol dehydrogenase family)
MRTVLITGASRGLGLASAAHLYRQGWRVVAAMRSVEAGIEKLCAATGARADDPRLIGVKLDLADLPSIPAAAQAILDATGAPDVVVHNAGIAAAGSAEETPIAVWQQLFTTNLFGPVALTQALLPAMRARGSGRIIAISSMGAIRGMPVIPAYSGTKAALERWAEALSQEIAPFGLGVSILVTGTFNTDILTEQTPDYGNHQGPYGRMYEGIHAAGKAAVSKASPPEKFARALGQAVLDRKPIVRRTVGPDAGALAFMARWVPGLWVHHIVRLAMKIPGMGALRSQPSVPSAPPLPHPSPARGEGRLPIDFKDQVVIVTGAGRGLGRLYALEFARRGAAVVVNDLGGSMRGDGADGSVADRVVEEIRSSGGRAVASHHSVATPAGGEAIVRTAVEQFGRLDAVVSNAGIFGSADFELLTADEWRRMLSVHLDGSFYLSQPAFRVMKAQGYGRFVFTSSSAGLFGQPQEAHYAAAKAGIFGLSNVVAIEGEEHGIKANSVLPFGFSRMVTETVGGADAAAQIPFLQLIDPKLVVPMVVFLASRACELSHHHYSTGAGRYARVFAGLGEGWLAPAGSVPTAEDIAANLGKVSATLPFTVPASIVAEVMQISLRRGLGQDSTPSTPSTHQQTQFTAETKLADILDNPKAKAVMARHYPEMSTAGPLLRMGRGLTLKQISAFPQAKMPPERLQTIVNDLQKL